jgi:Coenzyme A transferase
VDVTVLGGLQVDEHGLLANWTIPGKMVPGMGGAMDLVTGAKRVIIAMQHTAKGKAKIVKTCDLPLTSIRPVDLVVSEMAVITFPGGRATLIETAPGVTVEQVAAATEAELAVSEEVPEMRRRQCELSHRRGSERRREDRAASMRHLRETHARPAAQSSPSRVGFPEPHVPVRPALARNAKPPMPRPGGPPRAAFGPGAWPSTSCPVTPGFCRLAACSGNMRFLPPPRAKAFPCILSIWSTCNLLPRMRWPPDKNYREFTTWGALVASIALARMV